MTRTIRRPAVAGQFYDSDPRTLRKQITNYVVQARHGVSFSDTRHVRAVIAPHAGYVYSGSTATKTLARAGKGGYERVVVVAPSHRVGFRGLALSGYGAFQTPLGEFPVDTEALAKMEKAGGSLIRTRDDAHESEHALEVELPILWEFFPKIKLAPIICGHIDMNDAVKLADAMRFLWEPKTLWVISSDFTHYGAAFGYVPFKSDIKENLRKLDLGAADYIMDFDADGFSNYVDQTGATICGANPIRILLSIMSAEKDSLDSELIDYTTSGELTGDFSHCVSYAGIAFYDKRS